MEELGLTDALGLTLAEGETDGDVLELGDTLALGETLGLLLLLGDTLALGDTLGLVLLLGDTEAEGLTDGLVELDGLTEAEGDGDSETLLEGDTLADGLTDGLVDAEGLTEGDSEGDSDAEGEPADGDLFRTLFILGLLNCKKLILVYLANPGLKGCGLMISGAVPDAILLALKLSTRPVPAMSFISSPT